MLSRTTTNLYLNGTISTFTAANTRKLFKCLALTTLSSITIT